MSNPSRCLKKPDPGLWPGLLLALCLLLHACDTQPRTSIRFGLNTAPITLDPRFVTDAVSERICRLLYRRLVDFDEDYRVVPDLARWQKVSATLYRFSLGETGRRFHNGDTLTAHDVKATYASILDGQPVSPHRATLANIASIQVIDHDTVDFYLKQSDPMFPGRLNIGIVPGALIESGHALNTRPVGSGPLRMLAWMQENRLVLERLRDRQAIEFITVKDPTVRVLKLARGEIDLVQGNLTRENILWLKQQTGLRVRQSRGDIFTYIGFNLDDTLTGKAEVRRAIAHAIDREAIIRHLMAGTARNAGGLLPPDHWAGHPGLEGYDYNPALAAQLIGQLGYDVDHPLQLVFKTSSDPFRIRLATVIQDQLRQVGIDMEIRSYDWGTFYGDIKQGRFQMYSLSWVGLKLPDIFRHVFHSSSVPPAGANRGRFNDPVTDALIAQAGSALGLSARQHLYRALQERLLDQLPYVPLWYEDNVVAERGDIHGYALASDGNFDGMLDVQKISE